MTYKRVEIFEELIGKTFYAVDKEKTDELENPDKLVFRAETGERYEFKHRQLSCESVYIEEIHGDLMDLTFSPLVQAEAVVSREEPWQEDGQTYTFYKFATNKGSVTVRWIGVSNGWYSEEVTLFKYTSAIIDPKVILERA